MKELLRTTDLVLLTFVAALLRDAGINSMIADSHVSSVEGSIGAFPRRVLVPSDEWHHAAAILVDADLGQHIKTEEGTQGR